jgi:hypothetical protein
MEDIPYGPVKIMGDDGALGFVSEQEVGRILEPPQLSLIGACPEQILEKGKSGEPVEVIVLEFVFKLYAHQTKIPENVSDKFIPFLFNP